MQTPEIPSSAKSHCSPGRWNPRGWNARKKGVAIAVVVAIIALIVLGIAALVRPELLVFPAPL